MLIPIPAHAALPPRAVRAGLSAGAAALAIGLLTGCGAAAPVALSGAAPTVDPRLVVRGHDQPVSGTLARGVRLHGTLYPALPGVNTLRLSLRGPMRDGGTGRLEVVVTMPGMAVRSVRATLTPREGRYQGAVTLPMFGRYIARVILITPRERRQGTIALVVPLMWSSR